MEVTKLIHIVDDEDSVRAATAFLLELEGYTVRTWQRGTHFLAAAANEPTGCVIMDLRMPEMDGIEVQRRLNEAGLKYDVVNAGVSGDTSAGGLRRADWALGGDVKVLIVALGGNDALRGLPADELRRNLADIIERAQARNVAVILAGMEAPPNFGQDYSVEFRKVYAELAAKYKVALVPFLLDGVAGIERLTANYEQRVAKELFTNASMTPTLLGNFNG